MAAGSGGGIIPRCRQTCAPRLPSSAGAAADPGAAAEDCGKDTLSAKLRQARRPAPGLDDPRRYARHWTPVHLDFVVDDIDAAVTRLVEHGAVLEMPVNQRAWGRIAGLADDGDVGFLVEHPGDALAQHMVIVDQEDAGRGGHDPLPGSRTSIRVPRRPAPASTISRPPAASARSRIVIRP